MPFPFVISLSFLLKASLVGNPYFLIWKLKNQISLLLFLISVGVLFVLVGVDLPLPPLSAPSLPALVCTHRRYILLPVSAALFLSFQTALLRWVRLWSSPLFRLVTVIF